MLKQFTFLLLSSLLAAASLSAQVSCPPGQSVLRLELTPDFYWYEVDWQISVVQTGEVLFAEGCTNENSVIKTYCIPDSTCIEFKVTDEAGDGLVPTGFYKLFLNDVLIYENPK